MEDNEDAESNKSEVKLGKLQFSLDYDFQKGEVNNNETIFIFKIFWFLFWNEPEWGRRGELVFGRIEFDFFFF